MRKVIAGLCLTLGCACLHAQTVNLRSTIPFAFRAGEKLMPAGEYTIHYSNGVLLVREDGGQYTAAQLLTNGGPRAHAGTKASMEFHRYGERYFLAAVVAPAMLEDSRVLQQSPSERALARQGGLPEPVGIALTKP